MPYEHHINTGGSSTGIFVMVFTSGELVLLGYLVAVGFLGGGVFRVFFPSLQAALFEMFGGS